MKITRPFSHRFAPVALLFILVVSISFITRILLLIKSASGFTFSVGNLTGIFAYGFYFDIIDASYFAVPLVLYLWLVSDKAYQKRGQRIVLRVLFFLISFLLLFDAVSEWLFWDEFNVRFNFIAVDYLIYTTEVIGNIRQSYPIEIIVGFIIICALAITYFIQGKLLLSTSVPSPFGRRSLEAGLLLIIPVIFFFSVSNKLHRFSSNEFVNELAGNGMYELFAAYRNNELDYEQFYTKEKKEQMFRELRYLLQTPESKFTSRNPQSIERNIIHTGPEKKLNVVMISVESLSADFMAHFGNTQGITPNLDSLVKHSLFFTNLYATGTRTVRGLEALSLCIPPTPGQSIVRRPNNENLFSLGKVFLDKGYESKFIYGGYSYFDNMGYFFAHNSYEVDDRSKLAGNEIDYQNVWGVADENLFTLATREIEQTLSKGKPVFAHVMTTSNHRPFTYPDGRIDIPSHSSREGAVKYTDYAIGKFINDVKNKPWFAETVFVIVADHCASSAGATELPINNYHIPLLIYSPGNITPGKMERLMSQIDLGPTLLGMLNFSYSSKFFGYDLYALEPGRERVFISTYQSLGYLKNNKLVILRPQSHLDTYIPDFTTGAASKTKDSDVATLEAITWYESASYLYKHGMMK